MMAKLDIVYLYMSNFFLIFTQISFDGNIGYYFFTHQTVCEDFMTLTIEISTQDAV